MIPVSKPSITDLEKKYVNEALDSGWISSQGDFIEKFEDMWARKNNMRYGASCNSGTNAILLAVRALGIGYKDEVIVPEFTMVASAWGVAYSGATPVFVDCLDDLTIDPNKILEKVTKRTKAIMVVPIYGRKVSQKVYDLAKTLDLPIIEDMAEAHGIVPKGDIACYSFFGNKIITTGEGGMCLTNNKEWHERIQWLKSMAFDSRHTFLHKELGYNFRMTNVQAAIGCAQVERIGELLEKRWNIEKLYNKYLPAKYLMPQRDVCWMYDIDCGDKQEAIKSHLYNAGVDTRYFFKPMSEQTMFFDPNHSDLEAYKWSRRGIYLPTFPDLSEDQIKYITSCL